MGRIMAFDYGKKRIGIAVTDPMRLIASPLETVSPDVVFQYVTQYMAKEAVDIFVVGLPRQMNNEESESMQYIKGFVNGLKRRFPAVPVEMYDERFTSVLAHKAIIAGGVKKQERRDNKELVDRVSASIILQSYMESLRMRGM